MLYPRNNETTGCQRGMRLTGTIVEGQFWMADIDKELQIGRCKSSRGWYSLTPSSQKSYQGRRACSYKGRVWYSQRSLWVASQISRGWPKQYTIEIVNSRTRNQYSQTKDQTPRNAVRRQMRPVLHSRCSRFACGWRHWLIFFVDQQVHRGRLDKSKGMDDCNDIRCPFIEVFSRLHRP